MTKRNFLLGKGERLTSDVTVRTGPPDKQPPYTFIEARTRLAPMVSKAVRAIDALPPEACPQDNAIATITLNPEYIAKTFFPHELLSAIGLQSVGSRPRRVLPEKRSRDREPIEALTTELFVMGKRSAFRNWSAQLPNWASAARGAKDLVAIEAVAAPTEKQKIKGGLPKAGDMVFEVVLHTDALAGEANILPSFEEYLETLGIEHALDRRFYAGGLCFVELEAPAERAADIARFSIVRALREMPRLRMLRPTIRASSVPGLAITLPSEGPIAPKIRVAVFDGGLPNNHPLTAWATPIAGAGVGAPVEEYLEHGVSVTSALLFGHIDPTKPVPQPYAPIDHYRVLDDAPGQNPRELYEVLARIKHVLDTRDYDFVNLSLGPRLPIEDDDVHAWTAVLDENLAKKDILVSIAVGNDGEGDALLGLNRVQVPADCVNALAFGACDTPEAAWQRAPYSSVGPGRSPGLIKPDLVEFGGSVQRPFLVVGHTQPTTLTPTGGTSFASPSGLRQGIGVRAHFGDDIGLLAIRALLVHASEPSELERGEVGWGRVARSLDDIVLCDDDCVRVVYQGAISPAKYTRAAIPMPAGEVQGKVTITATLCYATAVDPHHPGNYTRAGLEATFRPHSEKRKKGDQIHADSASFFGKSRRAQTEEELRRDAWKWENCQHADVTFLGRSLRNPVFDIHYNARLEGHGHAPAEKLRYALIITVKAKRVADLYDQIVRRYATQLEALRPVIDIPVRT
ncbi:MAG: hypothetical protein FD124_2441 [Alphaproteobacteria bacterium]|nr:MAG: hypothetical protein FD160_1258 [Caulobacteraceae bacterium]TPW04818.1 MAG: hypothetical protein FD124_2441 [Alphaproteobacteria bacterium]